MPNLRLNEAGGLGEGVGWVLGRVSPGDLDKEAPRHLQEAGLRADRNLCPKDKTDTFPGPGGEAGNQVKCLDDANLLCRVQNLPHPQAPAKCITMYLSLSESSRSWNLAPGGKYTINLC